MITNNFERARFQAYYAHLAQRLGGKTDTYAVAVAHMVPNSTHFLPAISRVADLRLVLPKPKSVDRPEAAFIRDVLRLPFGSLSRGWAGDAEAVVHTLLQVGLANKRVVIVDIGGYFAESIDDIVARFPGDICGVMEGTENGVQKYEAVPGLTTPLMTVARSPLKLPEDYLVGSSVVFSVEAVLREVAQILQTRAACVIGYGRVGSGVASVLRGRGIATVVHDRDPVAMAEAAARGYQVYRRLDDALRVSSLVICATGNVALDKFGFASLRSGSVVASVTSADDEIDQDSLGTYDRSRVSDNLERYDEPDGRYFWLVNGGNAANFLHGAVIGPAIQLIEGEKLAAIRALAVGQLTPVEGRRYHELTRDQRSIVAEVWNDHFLDD